MFLVAVDPGTLKVGVAVFTFPARKHVRSALFRIANQEDYLPRAVELGRRITEFVKETVGSGGIHIALEDQFVRENPRSSIKVAHMAGITLGLLLGAYPDATYEFVPPRRISALSGITEKRYQHLGRNYHDAVRNFVEKVLGITVEGVDQAFAIMLALAAEGPIPGRVGDGRTSRNGQKAGRGSQRGGGDEKNPSEGGREV